MKTSIFALVMLLFCQTGTAQQPVAAVDPATMEVVLPEYVYCEIIAGHLPVNKGEKVLFDFGQKTEGWSYNWLRDAKGEKLLFKSGIEALNYMVSRRWEFVQAYTSGEKTSGIHYLLRLATSRLSPQQREQLLAEPSTKGTEKVQE